MNILYLQFNNMNSVKSDSSEQTSSFIGVSSKDFVLYFPYSPIDMENADVWLAHWANNSRKHTGNRCLIGEESFVYMESV